MIEIKFYCLSALRFSNEARKTFCECHNCSWCRGSYRHTPRKYGNGEIVSLSIFIKYIQYAEMFWPSVLVFPYSNLKVVLRMVLACSCWCSLFIASLWTAETTKITISSFRKIYLWAMPSSVSFKKQSPFYLVKIFAYGHFRRFGITFWPFCPIVCKGVGNSSSVLIFSVVVCVTFWILFLVLCPAVGT